MLVFELSPLGRFAKKRVTYDSEEKRDGLCEDVELQRAERTEGALRRGRTREKTRSWITSIEMEHTNRVAKVAPKQRRT